MARSKSSTKTCPDGTVVRANQKCPIGGGGTAGQTTLAPVNSSLPAITGTVQKGASLTCSTGGWDDAPTSFAYQWKVAGVNAGTGSSYTIKAADVGSNITCVVTASNAGGAASATASAVGPVIDLAPVNTLAPAIGGTATAGQVLTVSTGTWTNSPTGYAYQWKRNGSSISGATSSAYTILPGDNGSTLSCTVTATNSGGSASATSPSIGPIGSLVLTTYNTAFGTTDASTGWTAFPLHSGCRRVWVDSGNGNDANDGLSAATAKATYDAVKALYATGWTSGDQLMVAGGQGQVYTDNWDFSYLNGKAGISLAYPIAELSYDSTAPNNTALYGMLTGPRQPVIKTAGSGFHYFGDSGGSATKYVAISGITFDGQGVNNQTSEVVFVGTGKDGIIVQNCRFKEIELVIQVGAPTSHDAGTFNHDHRVTRCSFWGAWAPSGNAAGLYFSGSDNGVIEDCVFFHCGWKMGASRDDAFTDGGAHYLGHASYLSPDNQNLTVRRVVYGMNAEDGLNMRCGGKADCIVSVCDPQAGHLGGFSGGVADEPTGTIAQVDDWMVLGASKQINSGYGGKFVFRASSTNSGSYVNNLIAGDSAYHADADSFLCGGGWDDPAAVDCYMTVKNSIGYNWGQSVHYSGDSATHIHFTYLNSAFDQLPAFGTGNSGNTVSSSVTLPNAKTVAQAATALGFANVPAWINAMLYRPDLPWAQATATVWSTAYGKTLTNTPTCAVPSVGTDTPDVVFGSTAGTLTLSSTSFVHGTPKTVNILGCPAGWSILGAVLSTGFTVKSAARQLVYDGTGSAGTPSVTLTHSIENVGTHNDTISLTVS